MPPRVRPRTPEDRVRARDPRFRIQLVNADSGRRANQMDTAYEKVHEQTRKLDKRGVIATPVSILKLVWRSAVARDHIQHQGYREAGEQVRGADGNYLILKGIDSGEFDHEMRALVERFHDDDIDLEPGETNDDLDGILLQGIRGAIIQYADTFTNDLSVGLDELKREIADFVRDIERDRGAGLMSYGHNILEVAANARLAHFHGESMVPISNAIMGSDARYGVARAGVRTTHQTPGGTMNVPLVGQVPITPGQHEIADITLNPRNGWRHALRRPMEFINRNVATWFNEETASSSLVIAGTIGNLAVRSAASAGTKALIPGAAAAVWAFGRTYREGGRRRRHALRKWASGHKTPRPEDARRLETVERTQYATKEAQKLYNTLGSLMDDLDASRPESIELLLDEIAEVQVRRRLSNENNIDLILFSDDSQIERERTLLYKRLREATDAADEARRHCGDPLLRDPNVTIQALIDMHLFSARRDMPAGIEAFLLDDIQQKNRLDRILRLRKAAAIGGVVLFTAGLVGVTTLEVVDIFRGSSRGIFNSPNPHYASKSFLTSLFKGDSHVAINPHEHLHKEIVPNFGPDGKILPNNGRTSIVLPGASPTAADSLHLHYNPSTGHEELVTNRGVVVDNHLGWDEQGNASKASRLHERNQGFILTQTRNAVPPFIDPLHHHFHDGLRYMTEIHKPIPVTTEVPFGVPLYFLRGHEKMNRGVRAELHPFELSTKRLVEIHLKSLSPTDGGWVDALAGRLKTDPRNENRTARRPKTVVMIPVDTAHDGRNIYRTLKSYTKQEGIDPTRSLEIVLLTTKRPGAPGGRLTMTEIELFKRRHPQMKVRIIDPEVPLPPSRATRKRIRRALVEVVLADLASRGRVDQSRPLLIFNGAGSVVAPNYIKTVIDKMVREPTIDTLIGRRPGLPNIPDPATIPPDDPAVRRISQMVEWTVRGNIAGYVGADGANVVIRPEAWARLSRGPIPPGLVLVDDEVGGLVS